MTTVSRVNLSISQHVTCVIRIIKKNVKTFRRLISIAHMCSHKE